MGAVFAAHIQGLTLFIISLLPAIGLLLFGWRGGLALLVAAAVTIGIIRLARRRIGGMTGDVYGLTVELVELSILLVFAAQSQR
jgi:adenosylcobinamide-GDP ribazoletransferase